MKNNTIAVVLCLIMMAGCSTNENDSVKQAHEKNLNAAIDEKISRFMTEAADARMMDIEEGKLAMQNGTNDLIKNYGQRMVTDNTKLLQELRTLAASKNITLPQQLSNEKADELENLGEKEGKEFDQKFIKMMRADHKRDADRFESAAEECKDQDVKSFASKNLAVVESHLTMLEQVNDSNERITEGQPDTQD
jgi:putative membrane protein